MAFALPSLSRRSSLFAALMERVRAPKRAGRRAAETRATVVQAPPAHLTPDAQWAKLSNILERAVGGAANAEHLQAAATRKLDLAQYGLITLIDELSSVMTIPGRTSRTATLHVFGAGLEAPGAAGYRAPNRQALAA